MTSALVTGASGFIGRHVVARLRTEGFDVIEANSRSGDIADAATWRQFPAANFVVHLAGRSFVPDSWHAPDAFVRTNLLGTVGALEYARTHGSFVLFMSSYLYGRPERLPIPETAPIAAANPYALSKMLAEKSCRFYSDHFDVDVAVLRPFNVYGPGQADSFLIPTIVRQLAAGGSISVKDLEPRRDYVYVGDVAEAVVRAQAAHTRFGVFNIGSGVSHSVAELIELVQGIAGTRLPVISSDERRRGEVLDTVADIAEAKRALGWSPRWSLHEGLAVTVEAALERSPTTSRQR